MHTLSPAQVIQWGLLFGLPVGIAAAYFIYRACRRYAAGQRRMLPAPTFHLAVGACGALMVALFFGLPSVLPPGYSWRVCGASFAAGVLLPLAVVSVAIRKYIQPWFPCYLFIFFALLNAHASQAIIAEASWLTGWNRVPRMAVSGQWWAFVELATCEVLFLAFNRGKFLPREPEQK